MTTIYTRLNTYTDSIFKYTSNLNNCLSGYLFLRFKIDKKGNAVNVQTNAGTPHFLDSLFKQGLKRTNTLWKQMPNGRTYFMPIKYTLAYGCPVDTSSKKYSALEWMLKKTPNLNELNSANQSHPDIDFLNMINFGKAENSKLQLPIDCILLPPYRLANPIISAHPF